MKFFYTIAEVVRTSRKLRMIVEDLQGLEKKLAMLDLNQYEQGVKLLAKGEKSVELPTINFTSLQLSVGGC